MTVGECPRAISALYRCCQTLGASVIQRQRFCLEESSPMGARYVSRVARGGYPPPALTEPDLWASHPALRDTGVGRLFLVPAPAFLPSVIRRAT